MSQSQWAQREARRTRATMRAWALEYRRAADTDLGQDALAQAIYWRDVAETLVGLATEEQEAA